MRRYGDGICRNQVAGLEIGGIAQGQTGKRQGAACRVQAGNPYRLVEVGCEHSGYLGSGKGSGKVDLQGQDEEQNDEKKRKDADQKKLYWSPEPGFSQ